MAILMGFSPSILARESLKARETMVRVFTRYLKNGDRELGSGLIKARFKHSTEHKFPVEDIARFEIGNAIALPTNTAPATFWMVYHLYSDSTVLDNCRREIEKVISDTSTTSETGESVNVRTLDMSKVKTSCPILLSTFQEVLRVHTVGISTRLVMEDHMLDNKYLLKKGNTVMTPNPVQYASQSV